MSVRGVGRGGKAGGAKGAGGAGKAGGVSKGSFGSKVDRTESLVGPSGAAGSGNVGEVAPADPVAAQAVELARQLRSGQLASRDEASRKLIADILREKVNTQSKQLTERIFDQLKGDPRFSQMFDRLWDRASKEE